MASEITVLSHSLTLRARNLNVPAPQRDEPQCQDCVDAILSFLAPIMENVQSSLDGRDIHAVALLIAQVDKLGCDEAKLWGWYINFCKNNLTWMTTDTKSCFVRVLLNKILANLHDERATAFFCQRVSFSICAFATNSNSRSNEGDGSLPTDLLREAFERICQVAGIRIREVHALSTLFVQAPDRLTACNNALSLHCKFFSKALRPTSLKTTPTSQQIQTTSSSSRQSSQSSVDNTSTSEILFYHKRLRAQVVPALLESDQQNTETVLGLCHYMIEELKTLGLEFVDQQQQQQHQKAHLLDSLIASLGIFLQGMSTLQTRFCRQLDDSIIRDLMFRCVSAMRDVIISTDSATVQHLVFGFLVAQSCYLSSVQPSIDCVEAHIALFLLCRLIKISTARNQVLLCKSLLTVMGNTVNIGSPHLEGLCVTIRSVCLVLPPSFAHLLLDHVVFLIVCNWRCSSSFAELLQDEENSSRLDRKHQLIVSCGEAELIFRHLPFSQMGPSVASIVNPLVARALDMITIESGEWKASGGVGCLPSKSFALMVLSKLHASVPAARYASVKANLYSQMIPIEEYLNVVLSCPSSLGDPVFRQLSVQSVDPNYAALPALGADLDRILDIFKFLSFLIEACSVFPSRDNLVVLRGLVKCSAFAFSLLTSLLLVKKNQNDSQQLVTAKVLVESTKCCCLCIQVLLSANSTVHQQQQQATNDVVRVAIQMLCAGAIKAPQELQWKLYLMISHCLVNSISDAEQIRVLLPTNWKNSIAGIFNNFTLTVTPNQDSVIVECSDPEVRELYQGLWSELLASRSSTGDPYFAQDDHSFYLNSLNGASTGRGGGLHHHNNVENARKTLGDTSNPRKVMRGEVF